MRNGAAGSRLRKYKFVRPGLVPDGRRFGVLGAMGLPGLHSELRIASDDSQPRSEIDEERGATRLRGNLHGFSMRRVRLAAILSECVTGWR